MNCLQQAIDLHRQAVKRDEDSFFEDGTAKDEALAEQTLAEEVRLFQALCDVPCQTHADVQTKLSYIVNGTIGERYKLAQCLFDDDYGAPYERFLRSLVL